MRQARKDIEAVFREGTTIDEAMKTAVRRALRRHKLLGESIATADEQGRVVIVPPEEIPVDVNDVDGDGAK